MRSVCPLFGIRRLSAIRDQKMYCVYGNIGRYIHVGPLFGGGPLLGGSVIGGSTVISYLCCIEEGWGMHSIPGALSSYKCWLQWICQWSL